MLDIIRRRRRSTPPDTTPLVITLFSAAIGHRRTELGGYFLLKTDTNPYSWPYPTHEARSWPQPTPERQQTRRLWHRGCLFEGGFGRTPPETIGNSKTEFNRILCTSKSEAAVTSNKKLRCRFVEANYWQTRSIARPLCDSRASCFMMRLLVGCVMFVVPSMQIESCRHYYASCVHNIQHITDIVLSTCFHGLTNFLIPISHAHGFRFWFFIRHLYLFGRLSWLYVSFWA